MLRNRYAVVLAWLIVGCVGIFTYYQLRNQPFFFDANGYVIQSQGISSAGLLSKWPFSDIRGFGYPFFLTGSFELARRLHVGANTGIFLTQWPLFVGSAWLAAASLFRSPRTRLIAFVAIAANPLLVVYTAQAFTEALTISAFLFASATIGMAARSDRRRAAMWLIAGAAVSSFSMAIRPGSLFVPVCYGLAAGAVLVRAHGRQHRPAGLLVAGLVLVGLLAPLTPQVLINHRHYDSISPLPTYDLAGFQRSVGLINARYVTNTDDCAPDSIPFPLPNPAPPKADPSLAYSLQFYFLDWPNGPEALVLHIFSGFDPRPFLTDQHDYGTHYERWLQALTVALLFMAGMGLPRAISALRARRDIRIEVAFLMAVGITSLGILGIVEAEYRFGVIPQVPLSLLAALGIAYIRRPTWKEIAYLIGGYLGVLVLWMTLSDLLLSTSPAWQACK